jgi:hypothetical protein
MDLRECTRMVIKAALGKISDLRPSLDNVENRGHQQ